jgi:hypothetical protein
MQPHAQGKRGKQRHSTGVRPSPPRQVTTLFLARNSLTGPAFPPAWLESGALPQLEYLKLGGNTGLAGTLPEQLAWPRLQFMWALLGGAAAS